MAQIDLESDLLNYIVENDFRPGDRLPTISELTGDEHLGVSTSKVREQLEVARALGLVEVRSKVGTRLKAYSFTSAVRLSLLYAVAQDFSRFELFTELRNHIEVAFWNEACALLAAEDRADMRACVEMARAKLTADPIHLPNAEHRAFHLAVFRHLENPFVAGLLEAYWDAYDAVALTRYAEYSYFQKVWDYHERILEQIDAGDFDAARQTFIEHTRLLRHQPIMPDGALPDAPTTENKLKGT